MVSQGHIVDTHEKEENEVKEGSLRSLDAIVASQALQQQVYWELAEQTRLKVLCLENYHSVFSHRAQLEMQHLEITLASGLDELL